MAKVKAEKSNHLKAETLQEQALQHIMKSYGNNMLGGAAKMENTPVDIRNFMMKEQSDNKMIRIKGKHKEQ